MQTRAMQFAAITQRRSTKQILLRAVVLGCVGGVLFSVFVPALFLFGAWGILAFWVVSTVLIAMEQPRWRLILPAVPSLVAAAVGGAILAAAGFFEGGPDLPSWSLGGYLAIVGLICSTATASVYAGLD